MKLEFGMRKPENGILSFYMKTQNLSFEAFFNYEAIRSC